MSFTGKIGLLDEDLSGVILFQETDDFPPADFLLLEVDDSGTVIVNSNATQTWGNTYNTCMRSGKKVKPGTLIQEWTGLWVDPDFVDKRTEQDFVRTRAEELTGSIRPEADDVFITTDVSVDDL